jgi:hypothetical protein
MTLPTMDTSARYEALVAQAPRIQTLAQFDAEVRKFSDAWHERNGVRPKLWFRGHAHYKWFLCPPALRDPYSKAQYIYETHTFIEFKRRAIGLVEQRPHTDWGWLYLAQHHGLPTRLLDWTEASHIALFFAVGCRKEVDSADGCVWILNPGALNQERWKFPNVVTVDDQDVEAGVLLNPYLHGKAPEKVPGVDAEPLAIIPEYVTPRLRAQRGAFVAFGDNESALVNVILDDTPQHPDAPIAKPLLIDADYSQEIERELDFAGVAGSTVFPDIGGLCSELARRHERGRL